MFDDRPIDDPSSEGCPVDHHACDHSSQVTKLLERWRKGDERALDKLIPLIYQELRRLAHHYRRSERPDHTLQSTAIVHEAYLRLAGSQRVPQNRAHFIAIASRAMRQILVDYARNRAASKRDGGLRIDLDHVGATPVRGNAELCIGIYAF